MSLAEASVLGAVGMQEAMEGTVRHKVGESPPVPQAKVPSWFWSPSEGVCIWAIKIL